MTITAGSLIEAVADFNALAGPTTGTGATVNQLWSTGSGDYGYGQTAIATVSAGIPITALQWANLINSIRSMRLHQKGVAGSFSAPVAGTTIIATAIACQSEINIAQTDRLAVNSAGSQLVGSYSYNIAASAGNDSTNTQTRTVSFASIDQCRYFWNAGGTIQIQITGATNNNSTTRSSSIVTLVSTNFASITLRSRNSTGKTGSGGTAVTNLTTSGFYNLDTSYTTFVDLDSSTYYTGDNITLKIKTNGGSGANNGNGNVITFELTTYASLDTSDALDVTVNYSVKVNYPPTTYLTSSWGTAVIG
jgi:hypothetical protein